jgi:hypothetical protein
VREREPAVAGRRQFGEHTEHRLVAAQQADQDTETTLRRRQPVRLGERCAHQRARTVHRVEHPQPRLARRTGAQPVLLTGDAVPGKLRRDKASHHPLGALVGAGDQLTVLLAQRFEVRRGQRRRRTALADQVTERGIVGEPGDQFAVRGAQRSQRRVGQRQREPRVRGAHQGTLVHRRAAHRLRHG